MIDDDILWIRQSEITSFQDCRRRTYWSYWLGLTPLHKVAGTADTGTFAHAGLEALYSGGNAFDAMLELWQSNVLTQAAVKDNYDLAVIMLRGYIDWLEESGADAGTETISVERELAVPWGTVAGREVWLTGKVDREFKDMFGNFWLMDHKSVAAIETEPLAIMDQQRMTYAVMRKIEGGPTYSGGVHNQLKRVKRTSTAKPPFYGRSAVIYNAEQLNNHYLHMTGTIQEIVDAKLALAADGNEHLILPPHPSKDCSWKCSHKHLCALRDDGSDWEGYMQENFVQIAPVRGRVEGQ